MQGGKKGKSEIIPRSAATAAPAPAVESGLKVPDGLQTPCPKGEGQDKTPKSQSC